MLPEVPQKPSGPVTCLESLAFDHDEAHRAYFTEELRKANLGCKLRIAI